ncbi:hypothetical protein Bhyg_02246 [Pseudolycoriella hygida]|uniref:Uncharacterized protein n=1 Tax=Pseudolycoriella hygida TaxID=35572 RepID=A0A9Q0NB32_9DIPT|nr:hypothetical protein Bhyg_02246 [Pseudolycoriella hygida]
MSEQINISYVSYDQYFNKKWIFTESLEVANLRAAKTSDKENGIFQIFGFTLFLGSHLHYWWPILRL